MPPGKSANAEPAPTADGATLGDLYFERNLAAPRGLVFQAWTVASHFSRWFGPHGTELPVCEIDARVGGEIRFCHAHPNGLSVWLRGTFDELVPTTRLVMTTMFVNEQGEPAPHPAYPGWPKDLRARTTVDLADAGAGTRMTVRQVLLPGPGGIPDQAAEERRLAGQGWGQTLDRLDGLLKARHRAPPEEELHREIVISRTLDAPVERVFQAFTDPAHMPRWWGPAGFTVTTQEIDVREGGLWRFIMHGPDGTDYPNRIRFLRIVPHTLLTYDHDSDPADGAEDPDAFSSFIHFEDLGPRTRLTLRLLLPNAAIRDEKVKYAIAGGHSTVARLADYLTTM